MYLPLKYDSSEQIMTASRVNKIYAKSFFPLARYDRFLYLCNVEMKLCYQ